MDGADPQRWSAGAADWADTWDTVSGQIWRAVRRRAGVTAGSTLLDVGCGAGGLLAHADRSGIRTAGVDPAPGMLAHARSRLPDADLRPGSLPHLPWPDASFDATVAVNSLLFAPDAAAAVREMARVTRPGGSLTVVLWADDLPGDTAHLEAAADMGGDGGPLRHHDGLRRLLASSDLRDVQTEVVTTLWRATDDRDLVNAILAADERTPSAAGAVVDAARALHDGAGYVLTNRLYCCSGRLSDRAESA